MVDFKVRSESKRSPKIVFVNYLSETETGFYSKLVPDSDREVSER